MAKGPSPSEIKKHSSQTLKVGSKGPAVECFQQVLNANGGKLTVDGKFGSGTKKAVQAFQKKKKLTADGIVGPNTWGAASGKAPPPAPKKEEKQKEDPKDPKEPKGRTQAADPNACTINAEVVCGITGKRLQGAEVRIGKEKKKTASSGNATLVVPAGRYTPKLKKSKYESVTKRAMEIRAIAGGTLDVRFEMKKCR